MSRPVRPVMDWDRDEPPTPDADGRVTWWARLPGDELAEVHHVRAYKGRLRRWADRGRGPLLQDDPVALPRDNREPPGPDLVAQWRAALAAGARTTGHAGGDPADGPTG